MLKNLFFIIVLIGLYFTTFVNYLLFHTLAEVFSIVVAGAFFMITWNSKQYIKNPYLLFIGIAYLFIAFLDLLHTISYKGMPIFTDYGFYANQLWIGARYMESITLLIAFLFLSKRKQFNPEFLFLVYTIITVFLVGSIFVWKSFPVCFIEGSGLTDFKKISEYIICLILLVSMYLLYKNRKIFEGKIYTWILISMVCTIISELAFTFYISNYGFSNLIGHYFKIFSFYFIYKAIVETGIKEPYKIIFKELNTTVENLHNEIKLNKELEITVHDRTKKIEESEERYKQMFLDNQAIKLVIDPLDGKIVEANDAACNFYQYSKDKLLSMKIGDINTLAPEKVQEEMDAAKAQNRTQFYFPHKLANGEIRDVAVYSGPINAGDKKLLFSIIHDISERKKAEEALIESEERLRSVLDNSPFPTAVVDPEDENILYWSKSALEMFGHNPKILNEWYQLAYPDPEYREQVIKRWKPTVEEALQSKRVVNAGEYQIACKNGAIKTCELYAQIIPGYLVVTLNDITESKKLEQQLSQAQKMESVGKLAGGIAHEFNNILSIIIGNNELVMEELPEWSLARESTEEIRIAGMRARDVVKQLLTFSRQDDTVKKAMDFRSVVQESMRLIRSATPTNIELQLNLSDDVYPILGNETEINQLLINLCRNAVDAMPSSDDLLTVKLLNETIDGKFAKHLININHGQYVKLKFSDNGIGMDKKTIDRIFEPYFTTKGIGKGSGIGLSVVHGIVEKHGGAIIADSHPGQGSTFTVFFPAYEGHFEDKKDTNDLLPTGDETILYVDDEPSIAKLGKRHLANLGYTAFSATDPLAALEMIKADKDKFNLVISDMAMPGMTGEQLITEILKIKPDMPTIICTGYSANLSEKEAAEVGISAFVMKPLDKAELAKKVREVLDDRNQIKS